MAVGHLPVACDTWHITALCFKKLNNCNSLVSYQTKLVTWFFNVALTLTWFSVGTLLLCLAWAQRWLLNPSCWSWGGQLVLSLVPSLL